MVCKAIYDQFGVSKSVQNIFLIKADLLKNQGCAGPGPARKKMKIRTRPGKTRPGLKQKPARPGPDEKKNRPGRRGPARIQNRNRPGPARILKFDNSILFQTKVNIRFRK